MKTIFNTAENIVIKLEPQDFESFEYEDLEAGDFLHIGRNLYEIVDRVQLDTGTDFDYAVLVKPPRTIFEL